MQSPRQTDDAKTVQRSASVRTALILLSVALVFFGGIIASQYTDGNAVGIGVVGFAIIGLLLVALGSKLRKEGRR
jgi:hypothetical protein